jgi:hypothetical protein
LVIDLVRMLTFRGLESERKRSFCGIENTAKILEQIRYGIIPPTPNFKNVVLLKILKVR